MSSAEVWFHSEIVHIATKNGEWYPANVLDTIKKHQMSWTNNTTIFLNITQTFNKKMKENCFSSSWKEKNELEKRQILYYVVAVGPHTSSLFFLTNICHQILFFSEHLVNPLLLLVLTARMYYCWWNYSIWNSKIQLPLSYTIVTSILVKEKVQCPCCCCRSNHYIWLGNTIFCGCTIIS